MTNESLLRLFNAGQSLLSSVNELGSESVLEDYDRYLAGLYDRLKVPAQLCDNCGADCPLALIVDGNCPRCIEGGERYWKTTYTVVVLSKGLKPPHFNSALSLHEAITTGDCSGADSHESVAVSEDDMAALLVAQGSDPEFLIEPKENAE